MKEPNLPPAFLYCFGHFLLSNWTIMDVYSVPHLLSHPVSAVFLKPDTWATYKLHTSVLLSNADRTHPYTPAADWYKGTKTRVTLANQIKKYKQLK